MNFISKEDGDEYTYTHEKMTAIYGHNLYLENDKTVEECKEICNNDPECLAFEYGVAYGNPDGSYIAGDCQPQSTAGPLLPCSDEYCFNLDLYIKEK